MRRWLLVLSMTLTMIAFIVAATANAQNPSPSPAPNEEFSVVGCLSPVDHSVVATVTWSHAGLRNIQLWAYSNGSYLGEDDVPSSITDRNGSIDVSFRPSVTVDTNLGATDLQVNFYDYLDRWTYVAFIPIAVCS